MKRRRCLKWIVCISLYICYGTCDLRCPVVVEHGSSANLTCFFPNINESFVQYRTPANTQAARCPVNQDCISNDIERFGATRINNTYSYLEIKSVQLSDKENWLCMNGVGAEEYFCWIDLVKTPTCIITSNKDTEALEDNEEVTLSVKIKGYYCSGVANFSLQTGEEIVPLKNVSSTQVISDEVINSTFNVTDLHYGSMKLHFESNATNSILTCEDVTTLLPKLPSCNISSNIPTDEISDGDNITLSIFVQKYSCNERNGLTLKVGSMNVYLTKNNSQEISFFNSTFTMTPQHFGNVRLNLQCYNVTRDFSCMGVSVLNSHRNQSTESPDLATGHTTTDQTVTPDHATQSPISKEVILIIAICVPIVVVILFVAIVCVVRKSRTCSASKSDNDIPYADVKDNTCTRAQSLKFPAAYADVDIVNTSYKNPSFDGDTLPKQERNGTQKIHVLSAGYMEVEPVQDGKFQIASLQKENESPSVPSPSSDIGDLYAKVNKKV